MTRECEKAAHATNSADHVRSVSRDAMNVLVEGGADVG